MPRPILLDTNVLILLTVGLTDRRYIARHKRLEAFDVVDFEIVCGMVEESSGMVFSPNILTGTSNLVRQVRDPMRTEIAAQLAFMTAGATEAYVPSVTAVERPEYRRLGLADAVMLTLAESGATLLTADFDLYLAAARSGLDVINYNHLREQRADYH